MMEHIQDFRRFVRETPEGRKFFEGVKSKMQKAIAAYVRKVMRGEVEEEDDD